MLPGQGLINHETNEILKKKSGNWNPPSGARPQEPARVVESRFRQFLILHGGKAVSKVVPENRLGGFDCVSREQVNERRGALPGQRCDDIVTLKLRQGKQIGLVVGHAADSLEIANAQFIPFGDRPVKDALDPYVIIAGSHAPGDHDDVGIQELVRADDDRVRRLPGHHEQGQGPCRRQNARQPEQLPTHC
jgi:hypothetical protein